VSLSKGLPEPLGLEGFCAIPVYIKSKAPIINSLFAKVTIMFQGMDKFFHTIFFLHFFDKVKAAEINGSFDNYLRGGLITVSIPKKLVSHFTRSKKKVFISSHSLRAKFLCSLSSASSIMIWSISISASSKYTKDVLR